MHSILISFVHLYKLTSTNTDWCSPNAKTDPFILFELTLHLRDLTSKGWKQCNFSLKVLIPMFGQTWMIFLREKLNNIYNQSIKNRTFDNITNTQLRNASIHQDYFFLNICTYLNRHKLLYCIILYWYYFSFILTMIMTSTSRILNRFLLSLDVYSLVSISAMKTIS